MNLPMNAAVRAELEAKLNKQRQLYQTISRSNPKGAVVVKQAIAQLEKQLGISRNNSSPRNGGSPTPRPKKYGFDSNAWFQYQAIGVLRGRFLPKATDDLRGWLTTPEEYNFACLIHDRAYRFLNKLDGIEGTYLWLVYPKQLNRRLGFQLHMAVRDAPEGLPEGTFKIRGKIVKQRGRLITVEIHRNLGPTRKRAKPFKLNLFWPKAPQTNCVGRFYEFRCKLKNTQLTVKKAEHLATELRSSRSRPKPLIKPPNQAQKSIKTL